jgi:hypothetical protein
MKEPVKQILIALSRLKKRERKRVKIKCVGRSGEGNDTTTSKGRERNFSSFEGSLEVPVRPSGEVTFEEGKALRGEKGKVLGYGYFYV